MLRRRVENVPAAKRPAGERIANNRRVSIKNVRPIRTVAPEAGESRRRAAGAEPKLEAAVRNQIEHRRILCDADRLLEQQGHNARAETNPRRARRGVREKHKRSGKATLVPSK